MQTKKMSAPTQMAHYKNLRQIFDKYMCTLGKGSEDVWLMSGIDKKMVAGHQFVLGAVSPYFDTVFKEFNETFGPDVVRPGNDKPKMVLVMRGCDSKTLENLINYMYKGELGDEAEWDKLYALGEEFEVCGLLNNITEKQKLKKEPKKDENGMDPVDVAYLKYKQLKKSPASEVVLPKDWDQVRTSNSVESVKKIEDGIDLTYSKCEKLKGNLIAMDELLATTNTKDKWIWKSEKFMSEIRNGTKDKPATARQVVNMICSNAVQYTSGRLLSLGRMCHYAEIDGIKFEGIGNSKDEAREAAALKLLHSYLNMKFPFD